MTVSELAQVLKVYVEQVPDARLRLEICQRVGRVHQSITLNVEHPEEEQKVVSLMEAPLPLNLSPKPRLSFMWMTIAVKVFWTLVLVVCTCWMLGVGAGIATIAYRSVVH